MTAPQDVSAGVWETRDHLAALMTTPPVPIHHASRFTWRELDDQFAPGMPRLRLDDGRNPVVRVRDADGRDVTNAYECDRGGERYRVREHGRTNARARAWACAGTH